MGVPVVAIVGATGYVGNFLTQAFLSVMKEDYRVKEVRVITSKKSEKTAAFAEEGCVILEVNFNKKETLLAALKGVDIVICAMGTGPGSVQSRLLLLEAMVQVGVDVYFPSEFGTNHYSSRMKFDHPAFEEKKAHFKEASLKSGLKTVRVFCSMIMEYTFGSWCGLDCKKGVWRIPGEGNTPVALTASKDIGRFTVEAALLAWHEPGKVPDALEFAGVAKTLREYAEMLDAVSGKKTKLQLLSLQDAITKYNSSKNFLSIFPLLLETGALDVIPSLANGNNLLNSGDSVWTLKTFEEYAQETGGVP